MEVLQSGWRVVCVHDRLHLHGVGYRPGTCERCGKTGLRFVHVLRHPDAERALRAGACCAERLVSGYNAAVSQTKLANVYNRLQQLPDRRSWKRSWNDNATCIIDGYRLTVFRDKQNPNRFRYCVNPQDGEPVFSGDSYPAEREAKFAAGCELAQLANWWGRIRRRKTLSQT